LVLLLLLLHAKLRLRKAAKRRPVGMDSRPPSPAAPALLSAELSAAPAGGCRLSSAKLRLRLKLMALPPSAPPSPSQRLPAKQGRESDRRRRLSRNDPLLEVLLGAERASPAALEDAAGLARLLLLLSETSLLEEPTLPACTCCAGGGAAAA
jgi:hypothetical protein